MKVKEIEQDGQDQITHRRKTQAKLAWVSVAFSRMRGAGRDGERQKRG